ARNRSRLVRVSGPVKRAEQPLPRAVAGEDPTRSVPTVRGGCEPDDDQSRVRIAETRQRLRPVRLPGIACRRFSRRFVTPFDEARASRACDDVVAYCLQRVSHRVIVARPVDKRKEALDGPLHVISTGLTSSWPSLQSCAWLPCASRASSPRSSSSSQPCDEPASSSL